MLITLLVSFASIYAQEKYPVYCDVYLFSERDISKNAVISFDFGFDRNVDLLDESGKKMKFPSVFTAINYMAKKRLEIIFRSVRNKRYAVYYKRAFSWYKDNEISNALYNDQRCVH